tara:strand:- start:89 stop:739 length:651 start_codon:yes stop_codon:yes gene_type:complete
MKLIPTGELVPAYVVNDAIHPDHAKQIIEHCLPNLMKGSHFSGKDENFTTEQDNLRNSDVHFFHDELLDRRMFAFAKAANQALGLEYVLDCAEEFQFTSYDGKRKQHYNWHIDGEPHASNARSWNGGGPAKNLNETVVPELSGSVRKLSMSLLLNDDYEGGDLHFRWFTDSLSEAVVQPKKYDAIFFQSNTQHKVAPVTKGVRYSVVKWFGGPPLR